MQSLVFDMIKPEPLVDRVGLPRGRRPLLHESQGANKASEMMVPGTPQSSAVRFAS